MTGEDDLLRTALRDLADEVTDRPVPPELGPRARRRRGRAGAAATFGAAAVVAMLVAAVRLPRSGSGPAGEEALRPAPATTRVTASPAPCRPSALTVSAGPGAASSRVTGVRLDVALGSGSAPCTLSGYPDVTRVDGHGRVVATAVRRAVSEIDDPGPPAPIILTADKPASFVLSWPVDEQCAAGATPGVRLGGAAATAGPVVAVDLNLCAGGTLTIGPYEPTR